MNRRDRARQKKRKAREQRVRQQRHAEHSRPAEAMSANEDADELLDEPAEDDPADSPTEPTAARAPSPLHDDERTRRRIRRMIRSLVDTAPVDLEQAAASLASKTLEELDAEYGDDPIERAQDLAFRAWDTDDVDEMLALLDEALRLDPGCTDARTLLAVQQRREGDRLAALDAVIKDAAAALGGEDALRRDFSLWTDVAARPYLRARHERLKLLADAGRTDSAIAEGRALLQLDPTDQVLAHHHLIGALLEAGQIEDARALIDRFAGEASMTIEWARTLERFLSGDRRGAARTHRLVVQALPEVEELILGKRRLAERGDARAEAVELLAGDAYVPLARAWARHKEARRWLAEGALASTKAERRAVGESYRPPVAAFLALGEPQFGAPGEDLSRWPAYVEDHALSGEHVPDLLRMATDPALHEQDAKSDAVWAPVHAWRALGLLGQRGVPGTARVAHLLLSRVAADPEDDWLHEDAVHVLGLLGAPAFDAAAERLEDTTLDYLAGGTVACALAELGARHETLREPVIGKLVQALRRIVKDIEDALREEPGLPIEELVGIDEDAYVAGLLVAGLLRLHAGQEPAGERIVALVERAWELKLVTQRECGTREQVLTELRGAKPAARGEQGET